MGMGLGFCCCDTCIAWFQRPPNTTPFTFLFPNGFRVLTHQNYAAGLHAIRFDLNSDAWPTFPFFNTPGFKEVLLTSEGVVAPNTLRFSRTAEAVAADPDSTEVILDIEATPEPHPTCPVKQLHKPISLTIRDAGSQRVFLWNEDILAWESVEDDCPVDPFGNPGLFRSRTYLAAMIYRDSLAAAKKIVVSVTGAANDLGTDCDAVNGVYTLDADPPNAFDTIIDGWRFGLRFSHFSSLPQGFDADIRFRLSEQFIDDSGCDPTEFPDPFFPSWTVRAQFTDTATNFRFMQLSRQFIDPVDKNDLFDKDWQDLEFLQTTTAGFFGCDLSNADIQVVNELP